MFAANGSRIRESGERHIQFSTNNGKPLVWPFIEEDVNRTPKSVATTCDQDFYLIFTKHGGHIVKEKTHENIPFDRVGNTYALDAWIQDKDFARQSKP